MDIMEVQEMTVAGRFKRTIGLGVLDSDGKPIGVFANGLYHSYLNNSLIAATESGATRADSEDSDGD